MIPIAFPAPIIESAFERPLKSRAGLGAGRLRWPNENSSPAGTEARPTKTLFDTRDDSHRLPGAHHRIGV